MSPNLMNFTRFGAMDVTEPYKFICFVAMYVTAPKRVPKIGCLSSRGIKVVITFPSGGPGAGQRPAPGPPEDHFSSPRTQVPNRRFSHSLKTKV